MSSVLDKSGYLLGTENSAALYLQSRQIGAPLANTLSTILPPATSYSFGNYIINNWYRVKSYFSEGIPNTVQRPSTTMKILTISIILLISITASLFLYNYLNPSEGFTVDNIYAIQLTKAKDITNSLITAKLAASVSHTQSKETSQLTQSKETQPTQSTQPTQPTQLLYLQSPTFKQIGYIGNGIFDSNIGVLQQLKAGCRSFFCQIDYIESDALDGTKFCNTFDPCFIWRDDKGHLISKNSAKLNDVFKSIGEYGFSDAVTNSQNPILLFLHFVRFPYKKTDDKYTPYLSKVSKALEVLNPYLLSGGYYRASKENDLFKTDFFAMGPKVIIGTNIDTTLFQRNKIDQASDLDYKINFHYYENLDEDVDETAVAVPNTTIFALIFNMSTLLKMSEKDISKFTQINKNKYILVKPSNETTPTKDQVNILLNKFNVNVVLFDYFSSTSNISREVIQLYGNTTYQTISQI